MSKILNNISTTVEKYNMLSSGDCVVIGVSGGADSMLLLHYLISVKDKYNLNLIVANVEHGIRGEESLRDTEFVKNFCQINKIDFHCLSINAVDEAKQNSMSVEEYSRNARYDFFNSFKADKIATAHNLSDSIETMLFRLSRGTSLKGICGIPAVRDNIIRPLINCYSDDIRSACNDLNIPYVVDSTNNNTDYSRNFVRHNIIKDFKKLNSSFEKVASRFINSATEDNDYLDTVAADTFDKCFVDNSLDISKLNEYHISIIKRVLVKFLELNNISVDELHLAGTLQLLYKQGKYQINKFCFVISDIKKLRVAFFDKNIDFSTISVVKKVHSVSEFLNNCELLAKEFDFYCDYDKIVGDISVRGRIEGDSISPANRNCSKSLKKLFNEYKINIENRANIPIITDSLGIIGVSNCCCDERVKIDKSTKNVLVLKITIPMED